MKCNQTFTAGDMLEHYKHKHPETFPQPQKVEKKLDPIALADRMWKGKIIRLMDKYHRNFEIADYVLIKEAENDIYNLIDHLRLEYGIVQALAERERVLGIIESYEKHSTHNPEDKCLEQIINEIKNI